jgi:hypothetical protein
MNGLSIGQGILASQRRAGSLTAGVRCVKP